MRILLPIVATASLFFGSALVTGQDRDSRTEDLLAGPWNISDLQQTPRATWGETHGTLQEVYYEGEPIATKPTRVFAYIARPEASGNRVPGIVLVHGGGGTAFAEWAKLWAARGYAAIAMDLSGNGPGRKKLSDGGPSFEDSTIFRSFTESEVEEMWTYHAVAAVIRGHSLLAARAEVDADRIGMTGISWGGYLTCIAAGIDHRVKVAVPIYGCGFIYENSHADWLKAFAKMKPEVRDHWISLFDPSIYLPNVRCPVLFANGTNDIAFPLDSYQKSCRLVPGKVDLRIEVDMPHSHEAGWAPKEIGVFIDSVLKGGDPLPRLCEMATVDGQASAEFVAKQRVVRSQLHWTGDAGPWQTRKWNSVDATIANRKVYANLPMERPLTYFLSVTDERGAMTSAPFVTLP
jgi:dienelactone hydrolase